MKDWIQNYLQAQKVALDSIPAEKVQRILDLLHGALKDDRQVLVFGNGGSAANSSHFATDLGKGASDKLGRRFRVMSLNENAGWMTAIGNDYAYEDIFLRQIENHGRQGDIALTMSVSGNSPSCAHVDLPHALLCVHGTRRGISRLISGCGDRSEGAAPLISLRKPTKSPASQ